jgi:hypothetical protein
LFPTPIHAQSPPKTNSASSSFPPTPTSTGPSSNVNGDLMAHLEWTASPRPLPPLLPHRIFRYPVKTRNKTNPSRLPQCSEIP